MAIKDYSTDPDLNTQISGINIAEGCAPSGINNAIRQLMADVKEESEASTALRSLIAQEVAKCLKLSGGDIKGTLSLLGTWGDFSGKVGGSLGDNGGCLRLTGGPFKAENSGAYIHLHAKEHTSKPGWIELVSQNDSTSTTYVIKPDGTFTKSGKDILTSGGGTLTGNLLFDSSYNIALARDDGYLRVSGGTKGTGANFVLFGPDTMSWGNNGYGACMFYVGPNDGVHTHVFRGDGGVYFDGSRVVTEARGTAYATTRTPNCVTEYCTTSFTLPSGGTWKYMAIGATGPYLNTGVSGTVAGGTTVTTNWSNGGWYVAVRTA